jgi:hypothetical protein
VATTHPDASVLDAAIVGVLQADPILAALMPDGVHWELAPQGSTAWVSVALEDFVAELVFPGVDGTERTNYTVKATARTTGGTTVRDAAARIHDLLHLQTLPLEGTGFELMILKRIRRVRYTADDPHDAAAQWQHRGGVYQVTVSL